MTRNRKWRGDPLAVPPVVVDDRWYCCGAEWPDHDLRCVRMIACDGDMHLDVPDADTVTHLMSPDCPCGPERVELFASLSNPKWRGCGWKHRRVAR